MDPREQHELSRLLAGHRGLSRPQREAILDRVLAGARPRREATTTWRTLVAACAMAAAAVLWLGPRGAALDGDDGFTARGRALGPQLVLLCDGLPATNGCAHGHELGFEVAGAEGFGFLSIHGVRPDGAVIWYVPATADGPPAALSAGAGSQLVGIRAAIGDEHHSGRHRVIAVFSRTPIERSRVRALAERPDPGIAVVERELVVP